MTLERVYQEIGPGDRIIVRIANVTNTKIAALDPQGVRSFVLRVTASGLRENTDGPVEVRYEIDPNATAPAATTATDAPDTSGSNGSNANAAGGTTPALGGTVPSVLSGSPTIVGLVVVGGLGVAVLGLTYIVRRGRNDGSGGGQDRL